MTWQGNAYGQIAFEDYPVASGCGKGLKRCSVREDLSTITLRGDPHGN